MLKFKDMQLSDLHQIVAIEQASCESPWSYSVFVGCLRQSYYCPMLLNCDIIIGFGIMSRCGAEGHILNLVVNRDKQGNGFGRKILEHLLNVATSNNAKEVFLEVRASNLKAIILYESESFVKINTRKNYYTRGSKLEDAIVYKKEL